MTTKKGCKSKTHPKTDSNAGRALLEKDDDQTETEHQEEGGRPR